jgi:CubicO group peptidase (beta-lactamase class C family)
MRETLTSFSQFQESGNKTALHVWKGDRFSEVPPENLDNIVSAAGLYSSAHDMSLFLLSMNTLLTPAALEEIFTPQTTVLAENFLGSENLFYKDVLFPDCQFLDYGLGCFIHDYRCMKVIQVPGLTDGSVAVMAFIPNLHLSICILSNAESAAFSRALLFQIIDAHFGESADWNTHFLNLIQK